MSAATTTSCAEFFVDQRVVDPVDLQFAQFCVAGAGFEGRVGLIVPEAERFEEILIHQVRPGRHDGVHHVRADHLGKDLL
ncbi:MAG: hypothetical protein MUF25_27475 [Pirellulaceae bacterium]|nr:hypothetical protein [Pirellulaceae bacterium]